MSADDELVERLNAVKWPVEIEADPDSSWGTGTRELCHEAAACIERLTAALTAERERCAKVADEASDLEYKHDRDHAGFVAHDIAQSIRSLPDPEGGCAGYQEAFDAQKSIIGFLHETLLKIKQENAHYNFGTKLVRIVDEALAKCPLRDPEGG